MNEQVFWFIVIIMIIIIVISLVSAVVVVFIAVIIIKIITDVIWVMKDRGNNNLCYILKSMGDKQELPLCCF